MKKSIATFVLTITLLTAPNQVLSAEPMIGEIKMFAGSYAPRGWALCNGQLLSVSENARLFAILGTTFGGDGRTTFALPDLRGRLPMHAGMAPGREIYRLGERREWAEAPKSDATRRKEQNTPQDRASTRQQSLTLHFIIAIHGSFPVRQ